MFNYLEVMMQIYYVSNNSKELERTSKNHAEPDEILEKYQRIIEHQKQKTRNCSIISDWIYSNERGNVLMNQKEFQ